VSSWFIEWIKVSEDLLHAKMFESSVKSKKVNDGISIFSGNFTEIMVFSGQISLILQKILIFQGKFPKNSDLLGNFTKSFDFFRQFKKNSISRISIF